MSTQRLAGWLINSILTICAVLVTALLVRSEIQKNASSSRSSASNRFLDSLPSGVDFFSGGQRLGPSEQPPALVVFSDYECPACRLLHSELESRRKRGQHNLTIAYRHWPLPNHRFAEQAAVASECAAQQGRFAAMHDSLFAKQRDLGTLKWVDLARTAGVSDLGAFDTCIQDTKVTETVRADAALAESLRSLGTPTVIVRGGTGFAGVLSGKALDSLLNTLSH